nr:hypothetical protein [Tanacetum cinerariifolium]
MVLYTKLSKRVEDLQSDLQQTKITYGAAYTKLILRVKKFKHKVKTSQHRRRTRVVISDDEEDSVDPSKQGRKIAEIYENPSISLVQDEGTLRIQEDSEIYGRTSADTEILLDQEEPTELVEDLGSGEKGEKEISTVIPELQEAIAEADSAHDIDWNDPVVLRYHALQNRSFPKAKARKNMCIYLKNQGGYKQSYFKEMSYEDIRPIFERVWDQIHAFVPMDFEIEKEIMKKSRFDFQQKQFGEEVSEKKDDSKSAKRQKLKDVTEEEATIKYEKEKEELRLSLKINHNDDSEVNYEPLSKKVLLSVGNISCCKRWKQKTWRFSFFLGSGVMEMGGINYPVDLMVILLEKKKKRNVALVAEKNSLDGKSDGLVDQVHALKTTCFGVHERLFGYDNLTDRLEEFQDAQLKVVNDKVAPDLWPKARTHQMLNSSEYLTALGAIINHAIEKGMQDGLAVRIDHDREGRSPFADAPGMGDLQPDIEQLKVPIHMTKDQVVFWETSLSFSLSVSHSRVEQIRANIVAERSSLLDVWTPLSEPLFVQNLIGEASTSASVHAATVTTTALSTTFASATSIPPITIDDYEIVHANGQEISQGNV